MIYTESVVNEDLSVTTIIKFIKFNIENNISQYLNVNLNYIVTFSSNFTITN
jgi:hypothetical protein